MKPDVDAFSAGIDLDGGKIKDGGVNSTYEGFINLPVVEGRSAVRLSVYAKHDGGFIDNLLSTRHWVNGVTSTNAEWARNDYNTKTSTGGPPGVQADIQRRLERRADLGLPEPAARRRLGRGSEERAAPVSRFGPENGNDYVKSLDLHIDGDVGNRRSGVRQHLPAANHHMVNEYAEYVQYSTIPGATAADLRPTPV